MNRSTPGLPVHHQLPEFTQTHESVELESPKFTGQAGNMLETYAENDVSLEAEFLHL